MSLQDQYYLKFITYVNDMERCIASTQIPRRFLTAAGPASYFLVTKDECETAVHNNMNGTECF